jgi:hypothetical protein
MRKGVSGAVAALALACGACGGNGLYPVSGKVTFKGAPAAGAAVFFRRQGGDPMNEHLIMGLVQEDGSFDLVCGPLGKGAPPGAYDVLVEWRPPPQQARHRARPGPGVRGKGADRLKGRYADPKRPRLHAVVKREANEVTFALTD